MLQIDGKSLKLGDVVRVARKGERVALSDSCLPGIRESRDFVLSLLKQKEAVYGINTGVGELSNQYIPPEQAEQLQENLICSHASNVGDPLDEAINLMQKAVKSEKALSIALVGNCAEVLPELLKRDIIPDVVTYQTSVHNLLDYVPIGDLQELALLRDSDAESYKKKSARSHCKAHGSYSWNAGKGSHRFCRKTAAEYSPNEGNKISSNTGKQNASSLYYQLLLGMLYGKNH